MREKLWHIILLKKSKIPLIKPSSKPFEMALSKLELEAKDSLMIGDWPERDVIGAKKLNMKTAFARYGDMFKTEHSGADYDLDDISEIIEIVNSNNNE